jgi:3' terminal RNA ribose 2'-O-methyltransferase Hen1
MFLSIATTHQPANDLGFLLIKHPDRLHEIELSFGRAIVFFPEAGQERCEAVLVLDVDPVGLVRGSGMGEGLVDQYVNDRPYSASSFLAVALNRVFRTAMNGVSRERQELAAVPIPLEICVKPLPVRGSEDLVRALFEPLGWSVEAERIAGHDGPSRYGSLVLRGTMQLSAALGQLYVLIPVLDEDKHYWVGEDEVQKLLAKGEGWLSAHPERDLIIRRYLKKQRRLVREALARLAPEEAEEETSPTPGQSREEALEAPMRLHDLRLDTVAATLVESGASVVADLGCGEGKLLRRLLPEKRLRKLIGLDASARCLDRAAERLKLGQANGIAEERVTLLHGALTYRDERWHEAEAAALVEVIEHLDSDRLPQLAEVVFGAARPKMVVITTPNAEYNALFPGLAAGTFRHPDHRFEWTRAEFQAWASAIADRYGYGVRHAGIGEAHEELGSVTQMAVFTR